MKRRELLKALVISAMMGVGAPLQLTAARVRDTLTNRLGKRVLVIDEKGRVFDSDWDTELPKGLGLCSASFPVIYNKANKEVPHIEPIIIVDDNNHPRAIQLNVHRGAASNPAVENCHVHNAISFHSKYDYYTFHCPEHGHVEFNQ